MIAVGHSHWTRVVDGTLGSDKRKAGSWKMAKHSMKVAGVDVSKKKLDVAISGVVKTFVVTNDELGWQSLEKQLREHGVSRVGMEASGGYQDKAAAFLRKAGFEVVILDPRQVHAYRNMIKVKAKTDPIDAKLISDVAKLIEVEDGVFDERLPVFAEHYLFIQHLTEDIVLRKTRLEHFSSPEHRQAIKEDIERLKKKKHEELLLLEQKVRAHEDLSRKLDLLISIPCIAETTALAIVILMPELGKISRNKAAALVGVAPLNNDSGESSGVRHIWGGRTRVRGALYMAAFTGAHQWNPVLKEHFDRLRKNGKEHKVAIVACIRKLVHIANAILARDTPWADERPTKVIT
jgi:transposase